MRILTWCALLLGGIGCAPSVAQRPADAVQRRHFGICLHPHGPKVNEWSYTSGGAILAGELLQGALAHSTETPLVLLRSLRAARESTLPLHSVQPEALRAQAPRPAPPPAAQPPKKPPVPPEKKDTKAVVAKANSGNAGRAGAVEKKPENPRPLTAEEEHLARIVARRTSSRPAPEDERQTALPQEGILSREGVLSRRGILPWRDEAFPVEEDARPVAAQPRDGYVKVAATSGDVDCDEEQIACFRRCWKAKPPWPMTKGTSAHYRYCQSKCLAEYMECLGKQGLRRTFDSLAEALDWLKKHPQVVGTIVVVAGVVYVVSTGGSGALVLLPLGV